MAIQSNFPSVRPSLLLDFASVKQLDSRITYTRASTASYYDGVTTSKAEENLFIYSEDFTDTAGRWASSGTTVTANSTVAPNATTTADTLTATSGTSAKFTEQVRSVFSGVVVMSVYVKAGTNNYVQFLNTGDAQAFANFDVTSGAGVVGTKGSKTTSSIVDAGGGWYRCIAVFDATVAYSTTYRIYIAPSASATFAQSLAAAGTETIILWGAQVEQRSAVTAYTATTTQAITNYIPKLQTAASGVARFDNNPTTGESLGLLIEESRTNLVTYSSDLSNAAWTKGNATITADTVVAPDGTLTGDKIVESTATGLHRVFGSVTATAAAYTFSFYAKAAGRNFVYGGFTTGSAQYVYFDLVNGVVGTIDAGAATATSITFVGNGWYRCSITRTATAATYYPEIGTASANGTSSFAGDGFSGVSVWGAQVELGSFATSFIPTVASQVTRAADAASMTGTNFSAWYSADQGTIYSEFNRTFADTSNSGQFVMISDGSATNRLFMQYSASSNFGTFEIIVGGTTQASINSAAMTIGSYHKMGAAYKVNDIASSVDGATVGTDTSATIPVVNQMSIGNRGYTSAGFLNGTIKKLAYYPMRVTNAQLQALTS